jgi:hypothetical protein
MIMGKQFRGIVVALTAALGSIFMGTSCTPNPCGDVQCVNNGTCREGRCACPSGYEGVFCEFKASDKFIGSYNGFSSLNEDKPDYREFLIVSTTNPKEVRIFDRNSPNQTMKAEIIDAVELKIIPQQAGLASGFFVEGNAVLEKGKYLQLWLKTTDPFGVISNEFYSGTKTKL